MTQAVAADGQRQPDDEKPKYDYIDCVRGYAVMLVITTHLTYLFPELPYPVQRITKLGWHGVQLFFLASAITLLLSWHGERARRRSVDKGGFLIRRFFRIAPAYYLAGLCYFLIARPPGGFEFVQALTTAVFINSWSPLWIPTVSPGWNVVPGGWSIGVEFTFYACFPLFAAVVTSLPRAFAALVCSCVAAAVINNLTAAGLHGHFDSTAINNFLYFWFPNQLPIFILGAIAFLLLRRAETDPTARWVVSLSRRPPLWAAIAIAGFVLCAFLRTPLWWGDGAAVPPGLFVISLCFLLFVLALSRPQPGLFVNPVVQAIGKVSFSAYLVHFAILQDVVQRWPAVFHLDAKGLPAIAAFAATDVITIGLTFCVAWCIYRAIELPMMDVGRRIVAARRLRLAAAAAR